MQLLVSVRDAWEAEAALAGGADIVDAKNPHSGALGPVDPVTLRSIRERVPAATAVSAAIGDLGTPAHIGPLVRAMAVPGVAFLKLGFAGTEDVDLARARLGYAVAAAAALPKAPGVIAVAYADWFRAVSIPPRPLLHIAVQCGAVGFLVDTAEKGRGNLFSILPPAVLRQLGDAARQAGLTFAIAGSMGLEDVPAAAALGADIVGVRGAACEGGRRGTVSVSLVVRLRQAVDGARSRSSGSRLKVPARLSNASTPIHS